MKKVILSVLVISSLFACKKKAEISGCMDPSSLTYNAEAVIDDGSCLEAIQEQNVLVMEYTAKWCSPCGFWGAPTLHGLAAQDNLYAIALHAQNDPMHNGTSSAYNAFVQQRPNGGGIPYFYIGDFGPDIKWTMTNGGYYVCADNTIEDYRQQTAIASSVGQTKMNVSGNNVLAEQSEIAIESINLDIQTRFFEASQGEYYVGAYLIENDIDGGESSGNYNQAGVNGAYEHDYVFRKSFTSSAFGEQIPEASIESDNVYFNNFQLSLNTNWNLENCHVLIVVWEKDNTGFYKYINVNKVSLK